MNSEEERFESLSTRLAIPEGTIENFKHSIEKLYNLMNRIPYMSGSVEHYVFNGSFDRHTYIKKQFDADVLFVLAPFYKTPFLSLGTDLFNRLWQILVNLQAYIELPSKTTFMHAISITLAGGQEVDCIPALQTQYQGIYVVPEGEGTKLASPTRDDELLASIDGKEKGWGTKIARIVKCWNIVQGRPMKSYLAERLVSAVFEECSINNWVKGLRTYFQKSINIIKDPEKLPVLVDRGRSILEDYSDEQYERIQDALIYAARNAMDGEWNQLFGNYWHD